jgi:hypothetical protein
MLLKLSLPMLLAASVFSFFPKQNFHDATLPVLVVPAAKKTPGTPTVTNLMAGQTNLAGTVTVVDDRDLGTLTVTYQLNGGWSLKEVHLYVGTLAGIPVGASGNPRPGQFPYKKTTFAAGTQTFTVTIPLAGLPPEEITVASHAVVRTTTGCQTQTETAWGQGLQINDGGNWAMQFSHVVEVQ